VTEAGIPPDDEEVPALSRRLYGLASRRMAPFRFDLHHAMRAALEPILDAVDEVLEPLAAVMVVAAVCYGAMILSAAWRHSSLAGRSRITRRHD
jgi:hypothetical protein